MTELAPRYDAATISVIADDITPIVTQSQKLFGILQGFANCAATGVAVELWIDNERGRRSLAADMTDVANTGYDALTTNIRYFEEIKLTAESLARDGGTLDMLSRTHGKPEALTTHNRLVQSLKSQVRRCEDRAEELDKQLSTWRKQIVKMQKDVINIHGKYQDEKNEYEKEIKTLEAERDQTQSNLDEKLDELERNIRARANQSRNKKDLGLSTAFSVLSGDWRRFCTDGGKLLWSLLPGQSSDPNVVSREEIGRRRREAVESDANLTEVQITLGQIGQKKAGVEAFNNALKGTTLALALLIQQLKSLTGEFQESLALTATFAQGVMEVETNMDYSSEQAISRSDSELFFEGIIEMRDRARRLQYLSMLYARIIKTVMLTGCNAITGDDHSLSVYDYDSDSTEPARGRLALTYDNSSCVSIKEDIDRAYTADSTIAAKTIAQRREIFRKAAEAANKPKSKFSLFRKKS